MMRVLMETKDAGLRKRGTSKWLCTRTKAENQKKIMQAERKPGKLKEQNGPKKINKMD